MRIVNVLLFLPLVLGLGGCLSFSSSSPPRQTIVVPPATVVAPGTTVVCQSGAAPPC
jgi:hypothetical protein